MCKTFGIQPSARMRELWGPLLPAYITPIDWYVFDLTATSVYYRIEAEAHENAKDGRDVEAERLRRTSAGKGLRHPTATLDTIVAEGSGQQLHMVGNEIPPWDPRHPKYQERMAAKRGDRP